MAFISAQVMKITVLHTNNNWCRQQQWYAGTIPVAFLSQYVRTASQLEVFLLFAYLQDILTLIPRAAENAKCYFVRRPDITSCWQGHGSIALFLQPWCLSPVWGGYSTSASVLYATCVCLTLPCNPCAGTMPVQGLTPPQLPALNPGIQAQAHTSHDILGPLPPLSFQQQADPAGISITGAQGLESLPVYTQAHPQAQGSAGQPAAYQRCVKAGVRGRRIIIISVDTVCFTISHARGSLRTYTACIVMLGIGWRSRAS